jgi:malate dehydrogenase (oxaloacetate-decarboxylating)(NADP+)
LGSILCRASTVTDAMVEASSLGLAESLTEQERDLSLLYPRLNRIREISAFIATRVIRKAQEEVRKTFLYNIPVELTVGL